MSKAAMWTCDGCKVTVEQSTLERPPEGWHIIKTGNDSFTKGHICEGCYKGIFNKKTKAVNIASDNNLDRALDAVANL